MGYLTYFSGEIQIELKEPYLSKLQAYIAQKLTNKDAIVVIESLLKVNDEWKDQGLMEKICLFIEKHGKLIEGQIRCDGEDSKDVWEIYISDHQYHIREIGSMMTLHRSERIENPISIQEIELKL